MASMYSNGYLILAGTRSVHGNGGLFFKSHDVAISGITPLGEKYCIIFRKRPDHHIESEKQSTVDLHPLLTRAWVYRSTCYQRAFCVSVDMSSFFECKASTTCECGFIEHYESQLDTEISLIKIEQADVLFQLELYPTGEIDPDVFYFAARI